MRHKDHRWPGAPAARGLVAGLALAAALAGSGCRLDMHDQPKYTPLRESDFFPDQRASRAPVEGTVARGLLNDDELLHTGKLDGQPAAEFPFPVTREVLDRGRERFDIFCSPCHGRTGAGDGMIVRRGYRQPPTYHQDRLRQSPPGYFVDVMTNGFGAMPDYRSQVPPRDRWAIAAYVRALQLSADATLSDVPPERRNELAPGTGPGVEPK